MKTNSVIGIVAEYNPFHKGHAYQIDTAKKAVGDADVVAVMSSSFVQRGEPAISDKWSRAAMAIAGGVDLVLELPVIYACRSSQAFVQGALATLQATGSLTHLAFGCETKNPELLQALAKIIIDADELKTAMACGITYAAAVEELLNNSLPTYKKLIKSPNNILALEYYRWLHAQNSSIIPLPIQRYGSGYLDTDIVSTLPSASAIRKEILSKGITKEVISALPQSVCVQLGALYESHALGVQSSVLTNLLHYLLAKLEATDIATYCDTSEGLENKIAGNYHFKDFADLVTKIKSKRYPATRIQRLLCQMLISTPAVPFAATANIAPSYLRVLAFNNRGRTLLRTIKTKTQFPIINKLGKNVFTENDNENFVKTLKAEIAATNIYDVLQGNGFYNRDYTTSPIYISTQTKVLK
ncbi:MAG: nucleotidyltransferase family protein [Acidaminococcaceae bacterium]|nr:nucleotidyltransferase family protein [Acidaminococcaceae bacterium]MDD4721993.1 nucleotidyltransferase family protein [Acidaminococcaceae bacterium]